MPRILLLLKPATYRAGAFLEAARGLGLEVTVGSDRAQALADRNPDGHLVLDFEDLEASVAEVVTFARRKPLSAILAADDDGIVLAAAAATALGLRHNPTEAVSRARDKLLMRRHLASAGLCGPWWVELSAEEDPATVSGRVKFPCVIKPRRLAGGRGVLRADDPAQFAAALAEVAAIARSAGLEGDAATLLVEEFLPGDECSLEGLLQGGVLRTLAVFDKPGSNTGPTFEESIYVTPSRLRAAELAAVSDCVQQTAAALGLAEGPVHAQVRVHDGHATIVEIAPRSIGGLCSRAVRFEGGESLETILLRHALGEDVSGREREACASGVMMIPIPGRGILAGVSGIDSARTVPGVEDVRITIPLGQPVVPLPEGSRYLGFLFARGESAAAVEHSLREAHRRLAFDIRPRVSGAPLGAAEAHLQGRSA